MTCVYVECPNCENDVKFTSETGDSLNEIFYIDSNFKKIDRKIADFFDQKFETCKSCGWGIRLGVNFEEHMVDVSVHLEKKPILDMDVINAANLIKSRLSDDQIKNLFDTNPVSSS